MKKTLLKAAVAAALTAAVVAPAQAGVGYYDWTGYFTMLDANGAPMANSSIGAPTKKNPGNQFSTNISGTMAFDTVTGAGTATLVPFNFFSNDATAPAEAIGINMQAIGDGMGGPGTLVLGNMLFNWNNSNGIPVSLVLDAAGFFASDQATDWSDGVLDNTDAAIINSGAVPASDGIYVGPNEFIQNPALGEGNDPSYGNAYLALGPLPMVTTAWNTSFAPGCTLGDCANVGTSGILPLVHDDAISVDDNGDPNFTASPTGTADYTMNTGGNIGGNPFSSGPFQGANANFDVAVLTGTGFDANASLAPNCDFGINCPTPPTIPVPAAVWLFGSGLLGLVGVARRRKS